MSTPAIQNLDYKRSVDLEEAKAHSIMPTTVMHSKQMEQNMKTIINMY